MDLDGLSVACAGLGCVVEDLDRPFSGRYLKGDDCLENLKDLQRFLRRDHPKSREVFFQLGRWNTVGRNLVPIMCNYPEDQNLVLNAVKVVVFLTMPVDPTSDNILQQAEYLHHFKAAFLEKDVVAGVVALLEEALEHLEIGTLTEDDWKMVQLVITLFRNLLAVSTPIYPSMSFTNPQWLYLRDAFLECLFQESVIDLLVALHQYVATSHGIARKENFLLLEILYHIFWGCRPEALARIEADSKSASTKREKMGASLHAMLEEEKQERKRLRLRDLPRHSRFSGTFVQIEKDGSRKIFTRNPFLSSFDNMTRRHQIKRGPVKRVAHDFVSDVFFSKENVLKLLKVLADQLLVTGYNVLMQTIKEDIKKERRGLQAADIVMFFKVAQFFTSYQCCHVSKYQEAQVHSSKTSKEGEVDVMFNGQLCGPISATMDEDMFMLVLLKWNEYAEATKETSDWLALATAGTLMKDMIRMLDTVLKAKTCTTDAEQEIRVARILLFKVFYDQTESGILHLIHQLIRTFDMHRQPRSQLADLVEMAHVVIRLLESLTEAEGAVRILTKRHKGRQIKDLGEQSSLKEALIDDTEDNRFPVVGENNDIPKKLDDNISKQIKDLGEQSSLKKALIDDTEDNCFPVVGETNDISTKLDDNISNNNQVSKDSEPQQIPINLFEEADLIVEDSEKMSLQRSHEAYDVEEDQFLVQTGCEDGEESIELSKNQKKRKGERDVGKSQIEDEDGETDDDCQTKETSLSIQKIVSKFANNTVVKNYCWLLKFYSSNTPALNYYIIRMLERICSECALEPMLYQLSILQTFYDVLSDKKIEKSEEHKHMILFLKSLVKNMFKTLKLQPFLFVELLFWKTRQDCHEISANHMISKLGGAPRKLFSKERKTIAEALGDDEVDVPYNPDKCLGEKLSGLSEHTVMNSPVRAEVEESSRKKNRGPFTSEQEILIKELFELFKDKRSCTRLIAQKLDPEGKYSTAQVARKLKQLGLHRATKKSSLPFLQGIESEKEHSDTDLGNSDEDMIQKNNDFSTDIMDEEEDDQTLGDLFLSCKKKKHAIMKTSDINVSNAEESSIVKPLSQRKRKKMSETFSTTGFKATNESLEIPIRSNEEDMEGVTAISPQTSMPMQRRHKRLLQKPERRTSMELDTIHGKADDTSSVQAVSELESILEDNDNLTNSFAEISALEDDSFDAPNYISRSGRTSKDLSKSTRRKGFVIEEAD